MNFCLSEMPPNERGEENLHSLDERGELLRLQAIQHATLKYREALDLEHIRGGYLQGFSVETGEPTAAFRLDSKNPGLNDASMLVRNQLYVYVPRGAQANRWLERAWFKHVDRNGIESMFYVDESSAGVFYQPHEEEDLLQADEELTPVGIDVEDLYAAALTNRNKANATLSDIVTALRDDYELVPFRS